MSLRKSVITIGGYTFISRITGFIRDIMIAAILGAGGLADVFFVAFKMPNFFRNFFGEGAFNSAFVPMFSGKLAKDGQQKAQRFAQSVFSIMFVFLLGFTLIMQIAMPVVMIVLAPGFVSQPEQFDLAVHLTRITFPYLFFIALVALMGGVLNSVNRFAVAASAPILLNLCMIGALLLSSKWGETPAHTLSWGVVAAGIVQFTWLLFACRKYGYTFPLRMPHITKEVKTMLKLMIPGMIGAGIVQINLWINVMIGTMIPNAISYLYYADRINQLPLGVIGVAVGTAILPRLSRHFERGEKTEALDTLNKAMGLSMFLVLPACLGSIVLAYPIVVTLFERGAFTAEASIATALALQAYAVGLPSFVLIRVFTPGFFAVRDTSTPVKIALGCVLLNITLSLGFVFSFKTTGFYPHVGIALATSIAGWLNVAFLMGILRREGRFAPDRKIKIQLFKIFLASVMMAAVLLLVMNQLPSFAELSDSLRVIILTGLMAIAGLVYFTSCHLLGTYTLKDLRRTSKAKA